MTRAVRYRLLFFHSLLVCLGVLPVFFCGPPKPREVPGTVRGAEPVPPYDVLKTRLASEAWNERSGAILEIIRGEYRQAVPELLRLLQNDPHPAVRQTAALALGTFQARQAGPVIARMLASDREVGPEFLMDALIRLGDPAHAHAVLPYLDASEDILRLKAVEVLRELQASGAAPAVLAMAARNRDSQKARTYAMALGALKARSAESYLLGLARSEAPGPTLAAAYLALGHIRSSAAIPVLSAALGADFEKGRENAIGALIEIQDPAALDRMFGLLEHPDEPARYGAAEVIAGIPHASSGPRALALLQKRQAASTGPAAYVLGRLKYEPGRNELELQLGNTQSPERETLARALGWLGDARSVPLLVRVLSESAGEGRYGAAWALGIIGDERALDALRQAASSSDRKLALYATEALGALASPAALPDLRRAIERIPETRYAAIDAIAVIPGAEARELLEQYALSSDLELQLAAVRALGNRKENESIDTLMQVVRDGGTESARAAMAALRGTTGLPYENRSQWKHWHEMRDR